MEEIKEKLNEQANEIHLLKEIIVQGCKGIQSLSLNHQEKPNTTVEDEASKSEDAANGTQTAPDLPLPLPNSF